MFTYAQLVRVIQIFEELQRMVESISFTDRLPWTLVSYVMVFYVVRFVYHSKTRYNRLIVAQRENRRMRHEIEFLSALPNNVPRNAPLHVQRGIPIGPLPIQDGLVHIQIHVQRGIPIGPLPIQDGLVHIQNGPPQNQNGPLQIDNGPPPIPVPVAMPVPGALQLVVHAPVERQVRRNTLKRALDHMNEETLSVKQDFDLMKTMEAKHKGQNKTMEAHDAALIKLYKDRFKSKMLAKTNEHKEQMDALRAAHHLQNPNPTSAQIDEQTIELS